MAMLFAILLASAASAAADPGDEFRLVNPRAIELFEREPKLMDWALVRFDADGNAALSIFEADRAARAFRRIADRNGDGQVTPDEYRAALATVGIALQSQTALAK